MENLSHISQVTKEKYKLTIPFLLIILIIISSDYAGMYKFGINISQFKFIVDYQELLIINTFVIVFLSLLSILAEKVPFPFFMTITFLCIGYIFFEDKDVEIKDAFVIGGSIALTLSLIIMKKHFFIEFLINEFKSLHIFIQYAIKILLSFISSVLLFIHFYSINDNFNQINKFNNTYEYYNSSPIATFFKQKFFTTNRLNDLQTNIKFISSQKYINEIDILNKSVELKFDNESLFIKYLRNNKYKVFFILKKESKQMHILFTIKNNEKEEYQIINYITKKVKINNK